MERLTRFCTAVICLFLCRNVSGHDGIEKATKGSGGSWEVQNFPNPQIDVFRCGRQGTVSFVCDPDNVLTENEADRIDKLIQEVTNQTHCLCAPHGKCDASQGGLKVAVAVLDQLALPPGVERYRANIKKAMIRFGDQLNNHLWNYGFCGDNAVVVLSKYDRMIHTSIGQATKSHIHGECVDQGKHSTNADMNKRLYADAISKTITFYLHVIELGTTCEQSRSWVFIVSIVVPTAVFIIMYLVVRKLIRVVKDSNDLTREGESSDEASIGEGRPHFQAETLYSSCKSRGEESAAVSSNGKHLERVGEWREVTVSNGCCADSGDEDIAPCGYDGTCGCEETLSPPCSDKHDEDKILLSKASTDQEMDKAYMAVHVLDSSSESIHSRKQGSCQNVAVVNSKTTEAVIEQETKI